MKDSSNVTLLIVAALFLVWDNALAAPDFDADYYSECTLKNVKAGMDISAIQLIHQACKHKATPKKCRALSNAPDPFAPDPSSTERSRCADACKNESYDNAFGAAAVFYRKKFGDCSTG